MQSSQYRMKTMFVKKYILHFALYDASKYFIIRWGSTAILFSTQTITTFIVSQFSLKRNLKLYIYGQNSHHIQLRWHTTGVQIIMAVFLCRTVWTRLSAGCQIGDITLCLQLTDILAVSQILFETNCRCHVL